MQAASSVLSFYQVNAPEVKMMVSSISRNLGYQGSQEDICQEFYKRMIEVRLLQRHTPGRSRISTYVFRTIYNIILGQMLRDARVKRIVYADDAIPDGADETDIAIRREAVQPAYLDFLQFNSDSDAADGLALELRDFERQFSASRQNKYYRLNRRKHKGTFTRGCSLLQVFHYLYEGYTSHEIAQILGVTDMCLTHFKHKLARILLRYGFDPH